jgi:hypothetical protein
MKYFFALVIALFTVAAHAKTDPACVPFEVVNHRTIVQVEVNGHGPYPMVLDTGSQMTMIDPSLFDSAHMVTVGSVALSGLGAQKQAAGRAPAAFTVAGKTAGGVMAVEYDMTHAQIRGDAGFKGILGQNFLENFSVTLDYKHSCLSLQ